MSSDATTGTGRSKRGPRSAAVGEGDEAAETDGRAQTAPTDTEATAGTAFELTGSAAQERAARLAKVEARRAAGTDPYPIDFRPDATVAQVRDRHPDLSAGSETDDHVRIAGRVMLLRRQGKLIFADLRDASGTIQLFVSQADLGEEQLRSVAELDLGDWIGVSGTVMATRKGELSVRVTEARLLAKALRPLPDKWHGLGDVDTRYRMRYVDLVANPEARERFEMRFASLAQIRAFLAARGYVEVETPILQPIAGGATARPFVTHHQALGDDLYLRIAPELYLKRLLVGGFERVFEIGRVFRNEGLSTRHNPEFTMLECYEAHADYHDMMRLTEQLVAHVAKEVLGTTTVTWEGRELTLEPPWERATLVDLVERHAGVRVHPGMALDRLRAVCDELEVPYESAWGPGKLVLEIYEKTTEPHLVGPIFVLDYPREVSPLARAHRDDPTLTERFELLVGGREIANAFTELNDPIEQRERFDDQARQRAAGDDEASEVDHDYVRALEYGLPPCGGLGIGVDRLVMLLTGQPSIREVVLFPHLRPEQGT